MTPDNRNMILAIVLSVIVLFGWQFFVAGPQLEQAQRRAQIEATQQAQDTGLATPAAEGAAPGITVAGAPAFQTREAALAASPRVAIDTPDIIGSISLTGARIDDLRLKDYRETIQPDSPIITLLSPAGAPHGYYIEQGWVPAGTSGVAVPGPETLWTLDSGTTVAAGQPVTLSWDNGQGLTFRRTFAIDEHYLFTVSQSIANQSAAEVSLYPFARIVRQGTPPVQNFYIQHEGPLGVLGANNWVARKYHDLQNDRQVDFSNTTGWLGITDKYWATAVMPAPANSVNARFSYANPNGIDTYQTSVVETAPVVVAAGATANHESYVFAGAKEEAVISGYQQQYGFDRLDLLIDWGWLHFLTWPMFKVLTWLNAVLGNFGLAILALTVGVKAIFFPLASRSYASMAAMRRVQPEMKAIQERHKEDRVAMQQAMMELYKKEKINPLSGCWPILIQIPVFFALYTVLFISLEMRHAPFFGWIQDLAAQDPTSIFNLFGLLPFEPRHVPVIGGFLGIGVWPVIMGITMWVQMKLNPPPPDPTQAMIFSLMPILFTFMLGTFPAGLVIYWAWNNFLSIVQQWFIMKRHGVEVDLFGNILSSFKRKPKAVAATDKPKA
jgi:YidC/Oxa1 family membrane protein insertase